MTRNVEKAHTTYLLVRRNRKYLPYRKVITFFNNLRIRGISLGFARIQSKIKIEEHRRIYYPHKTELPDSAGSTINVVSPVQIQYRLVVAQHATRSKSSPASAKHLQRKQRLRIETVVFFVSPGFCANSASGRVFRRTCSDATADWTECDHL